MIFNLFRKTPKPVDSRPQLEQDSSLMEDLMRRVHAIEFQPSNGFLKDRSTPKLPKSSRRFRK